MDNLICMDENFSTTQLLTREKPIISINSEEKPETLLFLPENEKRRDVGGLRTKGYFKKSYEEKPLVSIITVVFNGEKHLEQTIQSVINQSYNNVEYIIIDGGSTDGTLDIIKKYGDQIDYWVSEPDGGIYDAMNKGISLCSGELVGIINSDDYYTLHTIEKVVESFVNRDIDIVYGDIMIYDENHKGVLVQAHTLGIKNKFFSYSMSWVLLDMVFSHPTMFTRLSFYKKVGLYDDKYRIAADYKFVLNSYKKGAKFHYNRNVLAHFRVGGLSTSVEKLILNEEVCKARNQVYGTIIGTILNKSISFVLTIKSIFRA